jgi:hypothetical protein
MIPDSKGNIAKVSRSGAEGDIMLGHVYWDRAFSKAMIGLLNGDQQEGRYDQELWETVLAEHVKQLPPMEIKVYPEGSIFEFDSLDELRAFDPRYVDDTQSRIVKEIAAALGVHERDITGFLPVKDGSKAVAFTFTANGTPYLWKREPGKTDAVITPVRRQ